MTTASTTTGATGGVNRARVGVQRFGTFLSGRDPFPPTQRLRQGATPWRRAS